LNKLAMLAGVFLAAAPLPAASQGTGCADTETQTGMTQCAVVAMENADGALNAIYKRLMRTLEPEHKAMLRDAQRAWIVYRDKTCAFAGYPTRQGSMNPMVIANCRTQLIIERTRKLEWYATCSNDAECPNN
jgi:uncharacterized protein YecT (DUF1311 family)